MPTTVTAAIALILLQSTVFVKRVAGVCTLGEIIHQHEHTGSSELIKAKGLQS
jgi:hypothetical protein